MEIKLQNKYVETEEIRENTITTISRPLNISFNNNENIYLIYQYFVPNNNVRKKEMQLCFKNNYLNKNFTKIFLLNEQLYNNKQLGIHIEDDSKLEQINIGKRLSFNDVYNFVNERELNGFIVICNSDIFFDDSIGLLNKTNLNNEKALVSLLRYEYRNYLHSLSDAPLFSSVSGPRGDSQDSWIFHSKFNINKNNRKVFNIKFGQPGCDNKILYLYKVLGYNIYNDPLKIKTYHNHSELDRNYTIKERIHTPYLLCFPYQPNGIRYKQTFLFHDSLRFNMEIDNNNLFDYIKNQFDKREHFIIPRIAGIENNYAFIGNMIKNNSIPGSALGYIKTTLPTMKNNTGINITSSSSIQEYSELYLKSFENCHVYFDWDQGGNYYKHIKDSHNFISNNYNSKKPVWTRTLDIFDYISNPWTHSLKGKTILIISSFIETIKKNIHNNSKIYDKELFPECNFVFLKPPQTNGKNPSRSFQIELQEFCDKIKIFTQNNNYDIALVSCGGYGNLVCNYIYSLGKSSIYVGGVLQMYFGILGTRWLRERPDIVKLYLNKYWLKPDENEKPLGYKNIEGSCYW
jgi:hypothetical protein